MIAASPSLAKQCLQSEPLGLEEIPGAIRALVEYLHTGDYDDEDFDLDDWPDDFEMSSMAFNVYVHSLAQKYGISALALLAKARFEKLAIVQYWRKSFAHAVKEAYTRFARHAIEIQQSMVKICCSTGSALLAVLGPAGLTDEQLRVCESLCNLARDLPQLKQDLIAGLIMHAECALPKWV